MRLASLLSVAVLSVVLGACATKYENTPLAAGESNPERRQVLPEAPDRPLILMSFSGGGSRAAALAETVLQQLKAARYTTASGEHPLIDDVKLVSSVSGGSVTAAWFGLEGPDQLDRLRSDFLVKDNMTDLYLTAANPVTWFRLAFTDYTRITALENLLRERLFGDARMDALNQPGKPLVILNATDMAGGESFGMIPRRFDDICSQLDALPVATGVAASAAFPIALTPVDFKNYSKDCKGELRAADWARIGLAHGSVPYLNLPYYKEARYTNDLRKGPYPFRSIDYLHFLDGGLADNLGLTSLRSALLETYDDAGILRAINSGKVRSLVIVVVNARSDPPSSVYQDSGTPGIISMLGSVTSVPIDSNTANAQLALGNLLSELSKAAFIAQGAGISGMKVYGVSVDFDQLPADTPAGRKLRDAVKDVPTTWTLSADQLRVTEEAGKFLLNSDPCYQALLADLNIALPAAGPVPFVQGTRCVTKIDVTAPPS
jgi:NTE family protein